MQPLKHVQIGPFRAVNRQTGPNSSFTFLRLRARGHEQHDTLVGKLNTGRQRAEHFSICFNEDAGLCSIQRTAFDGVRIEEFDGAREGLAASDSGKEKSQIGKPVAGLEGYYTQIFLSKRGAGSQCPESAAKRANADSEQLRDLLQAWSPIAVHRERRVEKRERVRDPYLESFKNIERVAEAAL